MSIKKRIKKAILKVLNPYNIDYISPSERKLLNDVREQKKREKEEADLKKSEEAQIREEAIALKDADFEELNEVKEWIAGIDKDHIWAFNSGNDGQDFRGNPKYLFAYINYYRSDIKAYWICRTQEVVDLVRQTGFRAYLLNSSAAMFLISMTGVCVNEQVRALIPFDDEVKYLNLWHGHGFKTCERARIDDDDYIRFNLAKKYIKCSEFYHNHMIVSCVNPLQEKYFLSYMGVPERNMLHSGYARSTYQKKYRKISTFDHDILSRQGVGSDTRIAVFAPTFRADQSDTFTNAFPNLERLYKCCEENNILLVFKMHPLASKMTGYLSAMNLYQDKPYFLFWDNNEDIYEIMDKVDLLIYDYSSIFNDFLLAGVKHYIRYIFDADKMTVVGNVNSEEEYYKYTHGTICHTFDDLIAELPAFENGYDKEALDNILKTQWEYSDDDDFERTINFTLNFEVGHDRLPVLYSFDIFDTLISREGLLPQSIFYAVKARMQSSGLFNQNIIDRYPEIRTFAESAARELMNKTRESRDSIKTEITLDQIILQIQAVYGVTDEQAVLLKQFEIEAELAATIPLPDRIRKVKELVSSGEKVILISDMYLPKDVITEMLRKADPMLTELPFFLSNEYGVLKSNRLLFFEVYRSFKPYYNFSKWIHTGDNLNSDQNQPRKLDIYTRRVINPEPNEIEEAMIEKLSSYDAFKVAAMQVRMRSEFEFARSTFVIDYVAPLFVSYVDWAIRDSIKRGFKTLYFVSRDGHPLKRIADALIRVNNWDIKTKYIYASRRVFRVPSYIDEIDSEYWANYGGNFNDIRSKEKFLHAAGFDEEEAFIKMFPQIDLDGIDFEDWTEGQPARKIAAIMKNNEEYHSYILNKAAEGRKTVCRYLLQEVDPSEKHAYVEFWGHGYNQRCHSKLWNYALGEHTPLNYYYARSVTPTEDDCVRFNMTKSTVPMYYIETIFANMPYKSIESYVEEDGRLVPLINKTDYDIELFGAMEKLLPIYAERYAKLNIQDPIWYDKKQFDFLLEYYNENKTTSFIYENFGSLVDAVGLYGQKKEFAKPYTEDDLENFRNKLPRDKDTMSITMSYARSTPEIRAKYDEMYQIEPGDNVAGGFLLSETQMEYNRISRVQYSRNKEQAERIKDYYNKSCQENEIASKITFLSVTKSFGDVYYSLFKQLEGNTKFEVNKLSCKEVDNEEKECAFAQSLATSAYVFINGTTPLLSEITFREGTEFIYLDTAAFHIYKKGQAVSYRLKSDYLLKDYEWKMHITGYDKASDHHEQSVLSAFNANSAALKSYDGSVITDVYFDAEYRENAVRKLREKYPEVEGKKVIYYLPDLYRRENSKYWAEMLDLDRLRALIGDEYYVLLDVKNKMKSLNNYNNRFEVEGFARLFNSELSMREMALSADIIIGDYRDTLFESVLLNKPTFFTGFDIEKRLKDVNFNSILCDNIPFPVIHNADEFAEAIKNASDYDFSKIRQFKNNYMTFCDGHAAERLLSSIL